MADQGWQWVDAAGVAAELLDGPDAFATPGVEGRFGPSIVLSTVRVPQQPGQRYQQVEHGPAEVKVPLEIYAYPGQRTQAEDATYGSGAAFGNGGTGWTGTGFVALAGTSNFITWSVAAPAAGTYNVDLRYANGNAGSRTLGLYVNGVRVQTMTLPVSGPDFNSYADFVTAVTLLAGTNQVTVQQDVTDTGGINVDFLAVNWPTTSATALRASLRTWMRRLDPKRGDGRLRVTAPAGDQRELICRYLSGLDQAVEDEGDIGNRLLAILRFTTEQPYWQDVADTVQSWAVGTPATFFPIFPLRLSASEVFADAVVANAGDVEAWPVWTITGPGSSPVLRNLTTGKMLSVGVTLLGGETLTIDTRPYTASTPNGKTLLKGDGTSLFGSLATGSSLWSLAAGSNSVRIEMTGATSASGVALNYRRRYLTA